MNKKLIITIVGVGLMSIYGWSQIPPTQSSQPLDGYRSIGRSAVIYHTVRQGGSSSYSSSGGYSSSSSSSSYSSGGSSYGK